MVQRMEELVFYHGQSTSVIDPTSFAHFSQLFGEKVAEGWRSIYTLKDIESCIEKVQPVRYTEKVSLFSTLKLVAYSSGYCLGSSNWLLETSFKKIAFLTPSSLYTNLHPAPFDYDILRDANVIVVGGLSEQKEKDLSFERAKTKLLVQIARTIHSQHNIILVSASMGLLFDLIGDIDSYFKSLGKEIGHERHQTPIYVANPIADQSLKYANICGEWMNSGRHDLLYVPEMPLAHGNLMRTGAVQTIPSLEAVSLSGKKIREPCIVFTGDPTCPSKGSLSWFLKHWGQSDLNTCVFIEPDSALNDIPNGCKINFITLPLDTRLKLQDLPSLLTTYWDDTLDSERHLLIPRTKGAELIKEKQSQQVHIYEPGQVLDINLNRDWERVSVSEKLAKSIEPTMIPTNTTNKGVSMSAWAPIHGSLNYYNNYLQIQPTTYVRDDQSLVLDKQSELRINTELNSTIKRFEEHSIPIQITKDINGITTIELPPDMNARVIMNGQCTTVVASDDKVRALLRKITVTDIREL
ncbi:beta-lactamase-like protein [Thamnidium elegans]|nr:beta-lactamase-like protein [Thamnidium elegans]